MTTRENETEKKESTNKINCYCNSGMYYELCCQPFIQKKATPASAEQLMRSRYTAFCIKDAKYIEETMKEKALELHDEESIVNSPIEWKQLLILDRENGKESDNEGTVTFRAVFQKFPDEEQLSYIEEKSLFKKVDGKWFYVDLIPLNN